MITQTQTVKLIRNHLEEKPNDWQARRELADLYEEIVDLNRSKLQKWLIKYERCPEHTLDHRPSFKKPWFWWSSGFYKYKHSSLGFLVAYLEPKNYDKGGYATCEEAEEELMRVLIIKNWMVEI